MAAPTDAPTPASTRGEDGVYLHLGVPKTGTTYIQGFVWSNRAALAGRGVLLAAQRRGDHFNAAVDLSGGKFGGREVADSEGTWDRVAGMARDWSGRSLISHELFGGFRKHRIEQIMHDVGSRRPVHVILTVRDLARIVPATWQEAVKNQRVESWPDYLDRVRVNQDGTRDPHFWRLQNVARILRDWSDFVPVERMHVVTVPPPGSPRTLLIERFLSVLGTGLAGLDTEIRMANESIGAVEVELLQRINALARERMDWPTYHEFVKHFAVSRILSNRPDQVRITLPDSELPWLQQETARTRQAIEDLGVDLVGDLDDLTPHTAGDAYVDPRSVTEEEVSAAAVDLAVGLVEAYAELRRTSRPELLVSEAAALVRSGRLREIAGAAGRVVEAYRRTRAERRTRDEPTA